MEEFIDVYRLLAKNYLDTSFEEGWKKEETGLLKKKLDAVGSLIENGDIAIRILKREIDDSFDCPHFNITLNHVVKAVFEIEAKVNEKEQIEKSLEDAREGRIKPLKMEEEETKPVEDELAEKIPQEDVVVEKPDDIWAKDEDEIIIKYYPEMTAITIKLEKLPHRSVQAIYDRAYFLKVQKLKQLVRKKKTVEPPKEILQEDVVVEKPDDIWTEDEDKILIEWYSKMPAHAIKRDKLPHRSVQAIFHRARSLKIQKVKGKKKTTYIMDESLLLKRYGNISVWKPVVDFILDNVSGEFTRKDVAKLVSKGYKTVLKGKIEMSSANTYAGYYVRYMHGDSSPLLIKHCNDPNISPVVYMKIKPEITEEPSKAKIEKPEPEKKPEEETPQVSLTPPFKETLHKYGNATIYKPVYDHLLETLPDKFNYKNVFDTIGGIYKEKTKRELKHKTLQTHAGRYIEYMTMKGKIEIDKESGMFVKTIKKESIETPEKQETQDPHGKWIGNFPKDQVLAKYDSVYVYKPVVDKIMSDDDIPDEFTRGELAQFLFDYYKNTLKRKISLGSADVYKSKYITYLLENNLIKEEIVEGMTPNKFIKIKEKPETEVTGNEVTMDASKVEKPEIAIEEPIVEKPSIDIEEPTIEKSRITIEGVDDIVEKPEHIPVPVEKPSEPELKEKEKPVEKEPKKKIVLSKTAKDIYDFAKYTGWVKTKVIVSMEEIEKSLKYSLDEIKTGLAELIEANLAWQRDPGKVKFK